MNLKQLPAALALFSGLTFATAQAAIVYDNTVSDSGQTIFFGEGPYSEIGDSIVLGGSERRLTDATVQFYNSGGEGTFDATLRFYLAGVPVGAPWGGDYTAFGILAPEFGVFDVTFSNLALDFPANDLVFTISIANADSVLYLGLNLFDPPFSPGTSDTGFLIVADDQGQFSAPSAGDNSNPYFQLQAESAGTSTVPEPNTWALAATGAALLAALRARRG
ncbi:MAG: hypothetical protein J0L64_07735 [Acidobacteria bacterium]|nr:hypothetical protein [Acidobacteriota bacterium]